MKCREAIVLVDRFLENKLEVSKEIEFKQHIEMCTDCASELANAKSLIFSLNSLENARPSDDFTIKTLSCISKLDKRSNSNDIFSNLVFSLQAYKRLGYSMIFTAFILLASTFVTPVNDVFTNTVSASSIKISESTTKIVDTMSDADEYSKKVVIKINKTFKSFYSLINNFNKN